MTSSNAPTEFRTRPLYFFDQPSKRSRIKGARNILHFSVANGGVRLEDTSNENDNKEGKSEALTGRLSGETGGEPDTSVGAALKIKDHELMDAYKGAAPQLLNELARLLSQYKWTERGRIPHGIVNILNYSWQDLAAGAVHLNSPEKTESRGYRKSEEARSPQVSANDSREAGGRSSVSENVGDAVRKLQVSANARIKKGKQSYNGAHSSATTSFSMASNSLKQPGWIIQPKQPSCDEPQWISLCLWVMERLQAARNPEKLQTADQDLNEPLTLRHYDDAGAKVWDRSARRKAQPATLVDGIPQTLEVKQQEPARQKLHCRINDSSSFMYYPSGYMAVCQSHSGLPCGGFYTNVFGDSERPVIMATITAFGHGAVTHPLSSAITAVWDQDGGFKCDRHGNITKEWSWQTGHTLKEKIGIQLSDVISVTLLSGTSAILSFRCNNKRVQLPLSALSIVNRSKDRAEVKFTSDAAQDCLLRKTTSTAVGLESKKVRLLTPVSMCSPEVLQMVRELEVPDEPSAQWKRGGHVGRELRRIRQRVRNTLEDWLDYYRVAIGIKCPDLKRKPDAPLRARMRREVQSAALPPLNPPELADIKPVQSREDSNELQEPRRHLSTPAERPLRSYVKLPGTPKRQTKEEPCVKLIGPHHFHGNIRLESVIIPNGPDLQPSAIPCCPAPPSFTPSTPVTVCPALLRAALLMEGGRRRCCCSVTLMPVVTDLEYDAFIMGQPPHSQQILVVCVTPRRQLINTPAAPDQDVLEQLYRRTNKQRTAPCTQCQMDSFRLVRYEMSTGKPSCGGENILLQQRHNTAPGMVLMYIRGKLLFVGYIFSGHSRSVRDLQKQISRTRVDYRLGLSLPPDYKFSNTVTATAATDAHSSQNATLRGGDDKTLPASAEKANEITYNQAP